MLDIIVDCVFSNEGITCDYIFDVRFVQLALIHESSLDPWLGIIILGSFQPNI